jgi:hypothetical protein
MDRNDLRETMLRSAASTYGSKHYRGILFAHSMRYVWPVLGAGLVLASIGWLCWPAIRSAAKHPNMAGAAIVGVLVVAGLVAAFIRHLRSPYRRRRYR